MPRRRVPNKRKILPDPKFLDRVVTRIVELDRGVLHNYDGAYEDFLAQRADRMASARGKIENECSVLKTWRRFVLRPNIRTIATLYQDSLIVAYRQNLRIADRIPHSGEPDPQPGLGTRYLIAACRARRGLGLPLSA